MLDVWDDISNALRQKQAFALCTLTAVKGSFGRAPGARMMVFPAGSIKGTLGGGPVEHAIIQKAQECLHKAQTLSQEFINTETATSLQVFIEVFNPPLPLYIFGAGHVCRALLYFLQPLEFDIHVVDPREGIFSDPVFDQVQTHNKPLVEVLQNLQPDNRHFFVLCSHAHENDYLILNALLNQAFAYLGMIGNTLKANEAKAFLMQNNNFSEEAFHKINLPIGINLPGKNPQEIALSIAAKLVMVKYQLNSAQALNP